jgi:isoleucyl-tRNA synthetase
MFALLKDGSRMEEHYCHGSIMITASHLPFNRNGLKFFSHSGGLEGSDVKEILELAASYRFAEPNFDGEAVELLREDLLIDVMQKEGYASMADGGVTVALDTKITVELEEEGFVREVISKVQTMRKESGFDVTDRIKVSITGSEKLADIIGRNIEWLSKIVLADDVVFDTIDGISKDWNINGENVVITVVK